MIDGRKGIRHASVGNITIGYEYERNPPSIPEDNIPPEEAIGGLEPPSEHEEEVTHQKRLEEDLVGLDEETDDESGDQT